jgi:hypothetical protein
MPQRVEGGRTVIICPDCKRDISGRVLIIYYPIPDLLGVSRPCGIAQGAGENGRASRP